MPDCCLVCGKKAPIIFSEEWKTSQWTTIMSGEFIVAMFCPEHEKDAELYWDRNHRGKGLIEMDLR
jgi:hypothetical protein